MHSIIAFKFSRSPDRNNISFTNCREDNESCVYVPYRRTH